MPGSAIAQSHAVILAPQGRDAQVAAALLRDAGVAATVCSDLIAFEQALDERACMAVVTEEAVRFSDLRGLAARVASQEPWSDLPFIVLTQHGGGPERNPAAARLVEILGNITFLERPFHPTTFVSVARTARKGRQRQYETRAQINELHSTEERVRRLNETLEERVAERTQELNRAHVAVLAEMDQREKAEEQLRQAQKMEMIGQLTGGVAHDFNNLLMAVLGNLDLLRPRVAADADALRLVEIASQGAQRGAALTQRLLAFARRQDLQLQSRDIGQLVSGMKELLERSMGSRIELRMALPAGSAFALVDANQVELALLNLAVNARDAMSEGGVVTVKVDSIEMPPGRDTDPGPYVRISVRDGGHGMDEVTLRKATEPFFTTKGLGKGTGLGLSMVHGLAIQLKGALRLSSQLGSGTTAELWLPATQGFAEQSAAQIPPVAPVMETAPLTILVVDDDGLILMTTAMMIADLGHRVLEAPSGAKAVEILRSQQVVDLMVTDYSMPRMTGGELAIYARELRPNLPILLASGYAELPPGAGINLPRLSKPYRQQDLMAEITKLLDG